MALIKTIPKSKIKESFSTYSLSGTGSSMQFVDHDNEKIFSSIGPTTVPAYTGLVSNFFTVSNAQQQMVLTATKECDVIKYSYSGSGLNTATVTQQHLNIGDTITAFEVQVQTHIDVY